MVESCLPTPPLPPRALPGALPHAPVLAPQDPSTGLRRLGSTLFPSWVQGGLVHFPPTHPMDVPSCRTGRAALV